MYLDEDCYVSDKVINEVVTVVNNRGNYKQAIKVYQYMVDNFKIINEHEIMRKLFKYLKSMKGT